MVRKYSLSSDLYLLADSSRDQQLMDQMHQQDLAPVPTDSSLPRFTMLVGPSPFTMPRGWEYYLTTPFEGITCIATVLHNAGFPARIVDSRFAFDPLEHAFREIMKGTDVLGITTFEDNFPWVRQLIDQVKQACPDMPVIVGGSLVTSVPRVFMENTLADIAVISEGELTVLELMESYARERWERDLPNIHGIYWKTAQGELRRNTPRGQMPHLDSLPRPRVDLWPQAKSPMGLQPQIITSYSRGCKCDCSFCFRTTPVVASKSPQKFHTDLAWLKEQYGTNFLFFSDLTWTADKQQSLEMCEVLEDFDFRWTCMTRCADVDKERLDAMKKVGADIILYGVESLGAQALKEARKPTTRNISLKAMHRTFEAGIRFGTLLIVGLPGETEEGLDVMSRFAQEYGHLVRVKYLAAMPGTSVYTLAKNKGLIRSAVDHLNWLSTEQSVLEDEFLNFNGLPERVMRDAYKRMYDSYQPGPVMNFKHYPENFIYLDPNPDDGAPRSVEYAGAGWRREWSSAGPPLVKGSERFTLDRVGTPKAAATGAALMVSGAKKMALR